MHLKSIILAAIASAAAVHASPGSGCRDVDFKRCFELAFPGNFECVNLKGDQLDSMTSVIVNSGYACAFYDNAFCSSSQGVLDNQRAPIRDLGTLGWNDRIASYLCTVV